jgi:hypothetical protein
LKTGINPTAHNLQLLPFGLASQNGADYTYRNLITIPAGQVSGTSDHDYLPVANYPPSEIESAEFRLF